MVIIQYFLLILFFLTPVTVLAYPDGPPDGYAGDPPNRATCVACHNSFPLNSGQGRLQLNDLPERFRPGEQYRLTVQLSDPNARRWGFELTALNENNQRAGTIAVVDQNITQISVSNQRQYLKHTLNGTFRNQANAAQWSFNWTAPDEENPGTITFYIAGNAANNNGSSSGDRIYAVAIPLEPQGPPALDRFPVALSPGWNLVSSPVAPDNPALDVIFAPLIQGRQLVMVMDERGLVFDPVRNINQIGNWTPTKGYQIKVTSRVNVEFSGSYLDPSLELSLQQGWNWITYPRTDTLHPNTLVGNLPQGVTLVRQGDGRFAFPGLGVNQLNWIYPGSGIILMSMQGQPVRFIWPEPEQVNVAPPDYPRPRHFPYIDPTSVPMNLVIRDMGDYQPEDGDELAVVTEDGIVWGSVVLTERGPWGITAWGDDPSTEEDDGLRVREDISFRVWRAQDDEEFALTSASGEDIRFAPYGIEIISLRPLSVGNSQPPIPGKFIVYEAFPNPFNSTTRVRFWATRETRVEWYVLSASGQLVDQGETYHSHSGEGTITLTAHNWPAGLYLVALRAGGRTSLIKTTLVK